MLSDGNPPTTNLSSLSKLLQTTDTQNTATSPPSPTIVRTNTFELPPDLGTEENEEQMTAVLREIVKIHKLHNKRIQFPYFNGKECTLVPIPKLERNSYHNFKQHKYRNHQIHFMEEILKQIGADCGDVEEQKHEAATIVSTYLAKKY